MGSEVRIAETVVAASAAAGAELGLPLTRRRTGIVTLAIAITIAARPALGLLLARPAARVRRMSVAQAERRLGLAHRGRVGRDVGREDHRQLRHVLAGDEVGPLSICSEDLARTLGVQLQLLKQGQAVLERRWARADRTDEFAANMAVAFIRPWPGEGYSD